VLGITATPTSTSNVISVTTASELYKEDMVKLPMNLFTYADDPSNWHTALNASIQKREELWKVARREEQDSGRYMRPILLIQAANESKTNSSDGSRATWKNIQNFLVKEKNIAPDRIKVVTGDQNELMGLDIMQRPTSNTNSIDFVITVQALAQGWDCPFAYVLCSMNSISTSTAVTQLVGRLLRLPGCTKFESDKLNQSYVYVTTRQMAATARDLMGILQNDHGFTAEEARRSVRDRQAPRERQTSGALGSQPTITTGSPSTTEEEKDTTEEEKDTTEEEKDTTEEEKDTTEEEIDPPDTPAIETGKVSKKRKARDISTQKKQQSMPVVDRATKKKSDKKISYRHPYINDRERKLTVYSIPDTSSWNCVDLAKYECDRRKGKCWFYKPLSNNMRKSLIEAIPTNQNINKNKKRLNAAITKFKKLLDRTPIPADKQDFPAIPTVHILSGQQHKRVEQGHLNSGFADELQSFTWEDFSFRTGHNVQFILNPVNRLRPIQVEHPDDSSGDNSSGAIVDENWKTLLLRYLCNNMRMRSVGQAQLKAPIDRAVDAQLRFEGETCEALWYNKLSLFNALRTYLNRKESEYIQERFEAMIIETRAHHPRVGTCDNRQRKECYHQFKAGYKCSDLAKNPHNFQNCFFAPESLGVMTNLQARVAGALDKLCNGEGLKYWLRNHAGQSDSFCFNMVCQGQIQKFYPDFFAGRQTDKKFAFFLFGL
jgi:hypothetical protein